MSLPHFTQMILPILQFGVENGGYIDGSALRQWLPQIMNICSDDLAIPQPRGADTMYEMCVRHAIKGAGSQGLLVNLGGRRYRITDAGFAKAAEQSKAPEKTPENPPPDGTWFARAYRATYRSEKEVEIRFVLPLLEHLGYTEDDRADGCPVFINIGSKRTRVIADFVCYADPHQTPETCLLLVEAKFGSASLRDAFHQARSYAQELKPLRILVTNGDEVEIWKLVHGAEDVCLFSCSRRSLHEEFAKLHRFAGKARLAKEKNRSSSGYGRVPQ